jgi:hypothetical protein
MPRPRRAHLFVGGKLAPCGLTSGLCEGSFFLVGEMQDGLFISSQLQNETRDAVLFIGRKRPRRLNGVIE